MTSTKAKRDAIDARARELAKNNTPFIWDALASEFDISRERARASLARIKRSQEPKSTHERVIAFALNDDEYEMLMELAEAQGSIPQMICLSIAEKYARDVG